MDPRFPGSIPWAPLAENRLIPSHGGAGLRFKFAVPALIEQAFWVEIWVENRRCPESVKTGAVQSGSMHPAIRLLEQSFALKGGGTLRI